MNLVPSRTAHTAFPTRTETFPTDIMHKHQRATDAVVLALLAAALVCTGAHAAETPDPPCLEISTEGIEQLREPCMDPALACADEGCLGAMVEWLAPQFEAADVDTSLYQDVSPEWMGQCFAPNLSAYMETIPIATYASLRECDYAPYVERWPELATFDFSAVSTSDFMRAMPPGMLMEILSNQRRQNRGW